MLLLMPIILTGLWAGISLGGTLNVTASDDECRIWSNHNHGCDGYSASFAKPKGDDCSSLSEMPNGSPENTRVEVACGTENGSPAAWIEVERDGQVTFFNQNGDKSTCVLNDGHKVGSWCNATDLLTPTTSSSASSTVTSPPFHTDGSVTPQPLLSCACPAV
ncbi:hypothetical protein F1880_008422 [Penicillium rolfsii]|nr:hypothetical protein F1880_008422 [Penicillium rolfsii]